MNNHFYVKGTLICFILIGSFTTCKKAKLEEQCIIYSQAPVSNVEGPSTAEINQYVPFTVYFGCYNGCGQFGFFSEEFSENTLTITVNAKYEGCICTQDAPTRQTIYNFKTSKAGTYFLKFFQTGNSYLVDTLIVQ